MISTIRTSLSSKRLSPRVCLRRPPLTNLLFVLFSLSLFSPSKNSICDLAQYIINRINDANQIMDPNDTLKLKRVVKYVQAIEQEANLEYQQGIRESGAGASGRDRRKLALER